MTPDQDSQVAFERALIAQLRSEAEHVKQCFTTYSFQSLAISATVLAASIGAMSQYDAARYVPLPMIFLLITVCRIGIYKYGTANRAYGFELHLARTAQINRRLASGVHEADAVAASSAAATSTGSVSHLDGPAIDPDKMQWDDSMRRITWEEACRAWRIVQSTMFRRLYVVPQDDEPVTRGVRYWVIGWWYRPIMSYFGPKYYVYRRDIREKIAEYVRRDDMDSQYPWFSLPDLIKKRNYTPARASGNDRLVQATYAAGTYLKVMMGLLFTMQFLLLLPLVISITKHLFVPVINLIGVPDASIPGRLNGWVWDEFLVEFNKNARINWVSLIDVAIVIAVVIIVLARFRRTTNRRIILEDGLLSIHSCAVTWQAVVLAHYRAIERTKSTYRHYTEELVLDAISAAENVLSIHQWMNADKGKVQAEGN